VVNGDFNWIANFIWAIADDVLRDLYVRGKYRDVILPMTVLRRLDAVLEPTKKAVLDVRLTRGGPIPPTSCSPMSPNCSARTRTGSRRLLARQVIE
jgi:HsdM N-terminal domain